MMKRMVLALIALLLAGAGFAGSAYVLENGRPDLKVWVCNYKSEADICVFVDAYRSGAKGRDQVWFFEKYKSNADFTVKFVKYKSEADLRVFYVKYKSEAGWRKSHAWTGRLH